MAVALVVVGGGLKNRTEDCWMSGEMSGMEYGESDLRLRLWPPGVECIGSDGAKLD